jgi:ubiquitin C-terminal hydrolase
MCSSPTCVACGLRKLSQTYWTSNTHDAALKSGLRSFDKLVNDRAIASKDSKFMWDSRVKRWRVGDQHDAQEYLQYILDEIHDPRLPKYYHDYLFINIFS